jgi:hypothetical protein
VVCRWCMLVEIAPRLEQDGFMDFREVWYESVGTEKYNCRPSPSILALERKSLTSSRGKLRWLLVLVVRAQQSHGAQTLPGLYYYGPMNKDKKGLTAHMVPARDWHELVVGRGPGVDCMVFSMSLEQLRLVLTVFLLLIPYWPYQRHRSRIHNLCVSKCVSHPSPSR